MNTYANAQERLNILNKDADKRPVLESIDRPIRPLILEMNRIGVVTRFSCCGYSYNNEEEPKSHAPNPNVLFVPPFLLASELQAVMDVSGIISEDLIKKYDISARQGFESWVGAYIDFIKIARALKWHVEAMPNNREWSAVYSAWNFVHWEKSDNLDEAIHDYELKLTAIDNLTAVLKGLPSFNKEFVIRDGNECRAKAYPEGEWMIMPKKPVTVVTNI